MVRGLKKHSKQNFFWGGVSAAPCLSTRLMQQAQPGSICALSFGQANLKILLLLLLQKRWVGQFGAEGKPPRSAAVYLPRNWQKGQSRLTLPAGGGALRVAEAPPVKVLARFGGVPDGGWGRRQGWDPGAALQRLQAPPGLAGRGRRGRHVTGAAPRDGGNRAPSGGRRQPTFLACGRLHRG